MRQEISVIRLENVSKTYSEKEVLKSINLEIYPGQIVGYLGVNGAGKTTTVKILIGILEEFCGYAEVCGIDIRKDPVGVKKRIGYVPETAILYEALSPLEFLQFHGRMHRMQEDLITQRAQALLSVFGLTAQMNRPLRTFSKGMKQKVLIAAGTLHNPDVLFFDEPMSGLDANTVVLVKEIIVRLAATGKTIFYCSHMLDVVERLCDRIIILNDGVIVADGSLAQLQALKTKESLENIFTQLTNDTSPKKLAETFVDALAS